MPPTSSRPSWRRKVEFTKVAEAFGAYGEKVADPADVPAAIARCAKGSAAAARRCCTSRSRGCKAGP